jgi:hypothetical protein
MADDFDALRTIREPLGELDADRAARMRARALASTLGEAAVDDGSAQGSVLTQVPTPHGPPEPRHPRSERPRRRERPDHIVRLVPDGPATEIRLDQPNERGGRGDGGHRPGSGQRGRRPFVAVAAAAAILAVVVGLAFARAGGRDQVVADQPRPTSVTDIAANAATLVDRPVAAGEYAYLSTETGQPFTDLDGTEQTHARVRDTWTSITGAGRERTSATEVVDGSGRTVATFDQATDTGDTAKVPGFGAFGYERLRSLPTDAAGLRAVLDSGELAPPSDYARSYLLADLLMLDATPPAVRSAALTILAEDGATVLDDAVDHDGHRGIGIVWTRSDGFTSVYVVNRDGLLVGSYDVVTGDALAPERAEVWVTVRDQRRVTTTD